MTLEGMFSTITLMRVSMFAPRSSWNFLSS
jgi:hypothetical protein